MRPRRLTALLAALLVLTGAAGLIYQVVWFRVLGQVFGVTVHATSAVLAAFMAGLALGSLVAGRLSDRLRNPLLGYAVMELAIGVSGFLSLPAFEALQPLYRGLATASASSLPVLTALRFVLAFAIMLVPTTLMGATLPMVVRSSFVAESALGRNVSLLYAFNTFGAILGAFLSAFYLIGLFGTGGAVAAAATLNVLVGAACLVLAVRLGAPAQAATTPDATTAGREPHHAPAAETAWPPALARTVLVAYGVSGGLALAYEVVWTRVLSLVFPQTVYAFALMLCAILAGIALGSWAMSGVMSRTARWPLLFAGMEVAIGVLAVFSVTVLARTYGIEALFRRALGTDRLLSEELWFMVVQSFLVVCPAALVMGALFPVAAKLYSAGHTDVGRRVGTVYAVNTCGAIAGSLLAGFVLIPALGSQRTMWLLGATNVLLGLLVFYRAGLTGALLPRRGRALAGRLSFAAASLALVGCAGAVTPDMYGRLFGSHPRGEQVLWYQEGEDATIRVARTAGRNLLLYVNSHGQASDAGSGLHFHRTLGHVPPLLHPDAREALVIGLGGGATAGAAAAHSSLSLTIVELHAGVIEGARLFRHSNYAVHERPNARMVVADGRNYLLTAGRRFDLIQGDIIPPQNAGAANLYSADYYRLAKGALAPGGLMVQWVDAELPEYQWKLLLRTFLSVFPDATLWGVNGSIIVGSDGPLRLDTTKIAARFRELQGTPALQDLQIGSVEELLRWFVATPQELRDYVGPGPIITDRYPVIEYTRTLPGGRRADLSRFSRDVRPLLRG